MKTFIFFVFPLFYFPQNYSNDSTKVTAIQEIIIKKEKSSSLEKNIKIKWSFNNNEQFLSLVKSEKSSDLSLKQISFKLANNTTFSVPIKLVIYENINNRPGKEIYSEPLILDSDIDILKINFKNKNNFYRKEGIFIGFELQHKLKNNIYIFTVYSKKSNSFIKRNNNEDWIPFQNQIGFEKLDKKYTNVDLYYKIQYE